MGREREMSMSVFSNFILHGTNLKPTEPTSAGNPCPKIDKKYFPNSTSFVRNNLFQVLWFGGKRPRHVNEKYWFESPRDHHFQHLLKGKN